ncbi:hypothetical protein F5X99DRAFT_158362 [Biscogniauxia marginata]|nr:hypothetical protein F5X99DRAFT_158362 [Biscogniauxia marginata]
MLRHLHIRARPTTRIRPCHHRHRHPPQPSPIRPQQPHDRRYSNYSPQQPSPTYFYTPRSRWSRVKDMAIGSALTIGAYVAWWYYDYRQFARQLAEERQEIEEQRQMLDEFQSLLAEAREAGDEARMRELVFERQRRFSGSQVEAGPLPGFPVGHEMYAKEKVPVEDTLMFVDNLQAEVQSWGPSQNQGHGRDRDQNQILDPQDQYSVVMVVVNADGESTGFDPHRYAPGQTVAVDPQKTKFQELLWRFKNQVKAWRREGREDLNDDILVIFVLRDTIFGFLYTQEEFKSVGTDLTFV